MITTTMPTDVCATLTAVALQALENLPADTYIDADFKIEVAKGNLDEMQKCGRRNFVPLLQLELVRVLGSHATVGLIKVCTRLFR